MKLLKKFEIYNRITKSKFLLIIAKHIRFYPWINYTTLNRLDNCTEKSQNMDKIKVPEYDIYIYSFFPTVAFHLRRRRFKESIQKGLAGLEQMYFTSHEFRFHTWIRAAQHSFSWLRFMGDKRARKIVCKNHCNMSHIGETRPQSGLSPIRNSKTSIYMANEKAYMRKC